MAITTTSAEQEPQVQTTVEAPRMASPGYTTDHQFGNFLFGAGLPPALSEEGEKHMELVQEHLRKLGDQIKMYPLPAPYVGTLFVSGNKGIITVYNDVLPTLPDSEITPISSHIGQVLNSTAKHIGNIIGKDRNIDILRTVLVFKEDYPRYRQYAGWIRTTLIHNQDNSGFVANLRTLEHEKFRLNYSKSELMNFVEMYSPHAVHDRMDSFVGLEMFHDNTWKLIAVQGAYTEFRMAPNANSYGGYNAGNAIRFVPFIHLQSPITLFPNLNLLSIMLPLAMVEFGLRGMWQEPYRSFAQNQPNLGSLFSIDQTTGRPPFIPDVAQMELAIQENFMDPIYVIDILHGRADIPGIELFADIGPKSNGTIGHVFANFFEDAQLQNYEYVAMVYREVVGAMTIEGRRIDTRNIDLFHMVDKLSGSDLDRFRVRGNNEYDRIKDIRDFYRNGNNEIESRYLNNISFLNGAALSALGIAIRNRISIETQERMQQSGISTADFQRILGTYTGPMAANFNFTAPQQYSYGNYRNYNSAYFNSPFTYKG